MLFRGAQMKEEWVLPYQQQENLFDEDGKPKEVNLPGSHSCSQNLKIAIGFAFTMSLCRWWTDGKEIHTPR